LAAIVASFWQPLGIFLAKIFFLSNDRFCWFKTLKTKLFMFLSCCAMPLDYKSCFQKFCGLLKSVSFWQPFQFYFKIFLKFLLKRLNWGYECVIFTFFDLPVPGLTWVSFTARWQSDLVFRWSQISKVYLQIFQQKMCFSLSLS